ncbi:MAG TPA: cellulase family glycosylhydrolase [Acetobacteraceae bacterium]|nr:cellulase family glycosylhydrolase [Acetobacteraceae bacterium]
MRPSRPGLAKIFLLALLAILPPLRATPARPAPALLGLNIAHWFRYPYNPSPAAMERYLSRPDLRRIGRAGYAYIRIPVDPALVASPGGLASLVAALRRASAAGLTVIVAPTQNGWKLERDPAPLIAFWHRVAPALRGLDQRRIVPETLNEPVFAGQEARWNALQDRVVAIIRAALPRATILVTGPDWSGMNGLAKLQPPRDARLALDVHDYEPALLTSLGAFDPALDHAALARLPFPVTDAARCALAARSTADAQTQAVIRYYCATRPDARGIGAGIAKAASWARAHRMKLILGEYGASRRLNPRARANWLAAIRAACARQHAVALLWALDDPMGLNLHPPLPRRIEPE